MKDRLQTQDKILLIEDTPSLQMIYASALSRAGYEVVTCGTAAEGMAEFRKLRAPVVLLDLMLPDRTGLELMQDFLEMEPQTCITVITANGSINKAVEMMRAGAHEFLVKPFDDQRLLAAVENARRSLRHRMPAKAETTEPDVLPPFIGRSPAMYAVYDKIRSVARSMATVFITGESGTGKELCAEAVHNTSSRARGPFIALNCGAIPIDLLESEVFGHLRGSFTGAISDKIGAAAAADGGTPLCLMLLDIDYFKNFNDTYGHQTGDQVLRLVAMTLKSNIKGKDLAARYGGEEFVAVLPSTDLDGAVIVAENIRKAIQAKELLKRSTNEKLGRITASFGVAAFTPQDNAMSLIERADRCLYAAKRAGRNRVVSETELIEIDDVSERDASAA